MRSASCGVSRYGSSTRGSGGRKRARAAAGPLAKEPAPPRALARPPSAEQAPADERVDGHA